MLNKYQRKSVFNKEGELLPIEQRTFTTNEGYTLVLINGGSKRNRVAFKIEDYESETSFTQVEKGTVKYPYHPSVFGVGYVGVGKHIIREKEGKLTPSYDVWRSMLARGYSVDYNSRHLSYKDVTVCKEWHNYQVFAEWFTTEANYQKGWHLDKDLLIKDNKLYSPETCLFIPQELNKFMTNIKSNNTSGYPGVCWDKESNKWLATINSVKYGKKVKLGRFKDIKEAGEAYSEARKIECSTWVGRMEHILPNEALNNLT